MSAWHGRGWSEVLAAEEALALAERGPDVGQRAGDPDMLRVPAPEGVDVSKMETTTPTPEESSTVGRLPIWTVRITVGDTEVAYRDFRAEDAAGAIRQAAELALARDLSECRDSVRMREPRMKEG